MELIKKFPLAKSKCEDNLFWPFTNNGIYNSKSGYRFLKTEDEPDGNDEQVELDRVLWRGIWSLYIPNKMKNLMWRAFQNSLPTKQNLMRRTIIGSPFCERCNLEPEIALHALWSCSKLDVVWEESVRACRGSNTFMGFKELLSWLIKLIIVK